MTKERLPYWRQGDKARLVKQDSDGDWWADFSGVGNDEVCYDGYWNVSMAQFEVIEE
ncbi:MAG: hypothetical protein ACXW1U_16485 [Methylobacter sp.]